MTDLAKQNFTDMLKEAAGPYANIVVAGELVQGELSPTMAALIEWRAAVREPGDDATEEQIEALMPSVRNAVLRDRLAAMTEAELEAEADAVRAAIEWKQNQREAA